MSPVCNKLDHSQKITVRAAGFSASSILLPTAVILCACVCVIHSLPNHERDAIFGRFWRQALVSVSYSGLFNHAITTGTKSEFRWNTRLTKRTWRSHDSNLPLEA